MPFFIDENQYQIKRVCCSENLQLNEKLKKRYIVGYKYFYNRGFV